MPDAMRPAHDAASPGGGVVRVTVHPGEDVLLPAGTTLAELRDPLADLLRRPELRHAALRADGVPLPAGTVVGERPLLAGATVTTESVRPSPGDAPWDDVAALRAPWLVARIDGPEAGELAPLEPGAPLALPGGVLVRVSARGVVRVRRSARAVRRHAAGRHGGARPAIRRRTANGRERRLPLGWFARRWRPGDLLSAGDAYALRRSGDLASALGRPQPPRSVVGRDATTSGATALATALVPALGSLGLALVLRQPAFALFALVGALAAVPQVATAARRRRSGTDDGPDGPHGKATRGVPDPARLSRQVLAALQAPEAVWRDAVEAVQAAPTRGAAHATADLELLPDRALAVRGPRADAAGVARAVVAELVGRGWAVAVVGAGRDTWAWCRWQAGGTGRRVLVADAPSATELDAAQGGHRAGDAVVLCLAPDAEVPPWCRTVLDVGTADRVARVRRTDAAGTARVEPLVGVSIDWAERFARRVTGARGLGRGLASLRPPAAASAAPALPPGCDPTDPRLPAVVPLGHVLGAGTDAWAVPLGIDAAGRTVTFDLMNDGPHLLVAGTTGAGKSELLQALVLALAARHAPRDLALALVDFKGGASFGTCATLPHVVGQVTDLDAALAARALEGLRAELLRRKRVLADHGASDLSSLPAGVLARLVVVVDEFRALADELPDLVPGLLRVAAQGRSLGVHLVLATQRPAGAVSADVRANVSARIALRVVDAADSHDVLDSPAAARIPLGVPGRAVLRVGAAAPVALQCAYAGAPTHASGDVVRRAPAWSDGVHAAGTASSDERLRAAVEPDPDPVAGLVAAVRGTAWPDGPAAAVPAPAPWLPPLPAVVEERDLGDGPGLALALGDVPSAQARTDVRWNPDAGHLAVLGRARTGRTTALLTLARGALARGWHVHALVPPAATALFEPLVGHPGFGTLAGPQDPRRAARLLRLLERPRPDGPRVLVLIDGLEQLRSALATATHDPLADALVHGTAAFAATAESPSIAGLAARFGPRIVLLSADAAGDVMLGAPASLAGRGRAPGRGVWFCDGDPVECQIARPGTDAPSAPAAAAPPPARVAPLPWHVALDDLAPSVPFAVGGERVGGAGPLVGLGGDDAAPVALDIAGGALVVGPRGSGRTAALRVVLHGLASTAPRHHARTWPGPSRTVVVARDRTLRADAARLGLRTVAPSPEALRTLVEELAGGTDPAFVLLDDADAVAQACPLEVDRLADLAAEGLVAVVASATTLAASMAHRGLLAHLRAGRTGIVLAPERGAEEVFGTALDDATEPGARAPGRGALVVDGTVQAVQLAEPRDGVEPLSASSPRPRAA